MLFTLDQLLPLCPKRTEITFHLAKSDSNCFVIYRYLPDSVSGDFDSIDRDLLNFYKEKVGYDTRLNLDISQKINQSLSHDHSIGEQYS